MAREVKEITIQVYADNWYGKHQAMIITHAWYDANQEIIEVDKVGKSNKYRIKLSNGEYKVIESHCIVYLETY